LPWSWPVWNDPNRCPGFPHFWLQLHRFLQDTEEAFGQLPTGDLPWTWVVRSTWGTAFSRFFRLRLIARLKGRSPSFPNRFYSRYFGKQKRPIDGYKSKQATSQCIPNCWDLFQHIHQGYFSRTEAQLAYCSMKQMCYLFMSYTNFIPKSSIVRLISAALKRVSRYDQIDVESLLDRHWFAIKRYVQPRNVAHIDPPDDDPHIDSDNNCLVLHCPRQPWRRRRKCSSVPLFPHECLLIQCNEVEEFVGASLIRYDYGYQRARYSAMILNSVLSASLAPGLAVFSTEWTTLYLLYLLQLLRTLVLLRCIAINVDSFALCGD